MNTQQQPRVGISSVLRIVGIIGVVIVGYRLYDRWHNGNQPVVVASDVAAPASNPYYSVGQRLSYGPNVDLVIVGVDGDQITVSDSDGDSQTVSQATLENEDAFLAAGVRSAHQDPAEVEAMKRNAPVIPQCPNGLWFAPATKTYSCGPTQAAAQANTEAPIKNYTPEWMPQGLRDALTTH